MGREVAERGAERPMLLAVKVREFIISWGILNFAQKREFLGDLVSNFVARNRGVVFDQWRLTAKRGVARRSSSRKRIIASKLDQGLRLEEAALIA